MIDDLYDQTERIRFGWPARLLLLGFLVGLCLILSGGCATGPIRRALDSELGVLCYYTNTAMSCVPVQVKRRGHKTDEAHTQNGKEPSQDENAGAAGR